MYSERDTIWWREWYERENRRLGEKARAAKLSSSKLGSGEVWNQEWEEAEKRSETPTWGPIVPRIDVIGQNGNDGLHYDAVEHPKHYTSHPSGVECIQITEHMGFNLGNALKYVWRCDLKKDAVEDLKKAIWYIEREIAKRTKGDT